MYVIAVRKLEEKKEDDRRNIFLNNQKSVRGRKRRNMQDFYK